LLIAEPLIQLRAMQKRVRVSAGQEQLLVDAALLLNKLRGVS
jgi:hypothetical protein